MITKKALQMREMRKKPGVTEKWNSKRRARWQFYKIRYKQYCQEFKVKHFFRWRAWHWPHGKVTARELFNLWHRQRGRCPLSGRKLGRDAHLDHIVPKCSGGHGQISNLRWLDPTVNMMRHNLSDEQFRQMCAQITEYIGRRIVEDYNLGA